MSHHGIDRGGVLAAGGAVIWGTGLQEALPLRSGRAGLGKLAALPGPDQSDQHDRQQHPPRRIGREEATSRYNFRMLGIFEKDTGGGLGCQVRGKPGTELSTIKRGSTRAGLA